MKITYSERISKKIKTSIKTGNGYYSTYHQLTRNKGIKIFKNRFSKIENLKKSKVLHNALQEAINLITAYERFPFVPKFHDINIIKFGNKYGIGIIMEHLGNMTLEDYCDINGHDSYEIISDLEHELHKHKIFHDDIHDRNVMLYNDKWYVIDFGCNGVGFR